ncbi:MAG: hypothetical protein ACI8Y4_004891 [Candidatus Poriferisodalaceae bacterium]
MFTVCGTKKLLYRVGRPVPDPPASSTVLGDWYANVLFWKPQVALFVNATTFMPVLMPLAPAAGVVGRFPAAMADVFATLGIDPRFVAAETVEMQSVVLAKTASRQVLGVMNEFVFMAEHTISTGRSDHTDLAGLSVWLANTIVGPVSREDGSTPLGALQNRVAAAIED